VFEAFGKIVNCRLSTDPTRPGKHKGYGFIEYDTHQACNDAVSSMNLFDLGGQYLRVGKAVTPPDAGAAPSVPSSMPTAAAVAAAAVTAKITAIEVTGGSVGSSPIAPPSIGAPGIATPNISAPGIAIPQIASPAGLAGPGVVIPQLGGSGTPVGSAHTSPALSATGRSPVLTPQVSTIPQSVPAPGNQGPQQLTEAQKKLVNEEQAQTLAQQENIKISGSNARHMVMQKLMRKKSESRVMVLRNMVGPEDLDDELETEVTDECGKFGVVNRVIIYQERQGEEADAEIIVKIFVEFSSQSEMETAVRTLNGRYFGGHVVSAQSYDQDMYEANDLSG